MQTIDDVMCEDAAIEEFDEFLDENHHIEILDSEYSASEVLKTVDPTGYRAFFLDYFDDRNARVVDERRGEEYELVHQKCDECHSTQLTNPDLYALRYPENVYEWACCDVCGESIENGGVVVRVGKVPA